MKVTNISVNISTNTATDGEISTECQLILFRSPVIFRIGGKDTVIEPSSVIIYTNGFQRYYRPADGNGIRYDLVTFSMIPADRQYAESMNLPFNKPIKLNDDYIIKGLLRSIGSHIMQKSRYQHEFMELSMRLIFITLSENLSPLPMDKYETVPRYSELKALREAIYDDPTNHWSADEMSYDMGISRTYFHKLYQAAFGVTCRQDIIESRLIYAAELLRTTDMSISEIAEKCGYVSDAYFMRQFKLHKGCTPSQYRRRSKADDL